ncbi:UNVERIFIED_CONTAM: hypothetical protein Sindi_1262200 [Sesamum indicum]
MWEKLTELGQTISIPWLIMGDFNCVKSPKEKHLGVKPTWYELKDFVDCRTALRLLDVPTTGCYYTWYSNNESNTVWRKLDRVLYNNEWLEAGLHCSAYFNPPGCLSDHSTGIVTIFDHTPTKPKPFRLFNMWAEHPDFLSTGTPQFILCKRLKALKAELRVFNTLHYSHISTRAKEADLALQDAQNQLENNPENVTLRESLGDLRRKVVFLVEAKRHFFYQEAKIHYLKEGDENTKFFHDMVKRNAARNSITAVTRADGTIITSADEIAQEFVDYYTSLLGTESHTIPVDDGLTDELCTEVTVVEVKDAIFNINDNKAPGPDGYSSCFFKKAWNLVGDQVCRAVLDFFRNGRMLRQLNHTVITLVPKSEHSASVADYRPISCWNVIYKAITKIILDRLAPALEHLIDRYQSAFIGGRNITDNIFLAQEMPYDSVSWTFLSRVLHGYGFFPMFIAWIMECVCTSSFFVSLNGSLHGFFPGKKGLRQGDPMSPALFLLSMEYLSRMIKRKASNSNFNYHSKCEKLKITHLLFADDLMLFSRGDLPSIHILMECLQGFRDASGLSVNTSKSCIFTVGVRNEELDEILARTEFARGEMRIRYLGIPLASQRLSVNKYSPLVGQVAKCILKWKSKSLSYAGRLELIRSVIQGMECFWLQVFPLPTVEESGLGIRHIQSWNVALLARILWNIHRKVDTLWVQWVNGVYLRGASTWDWQPKKGDSPLLKRLADIRNTAIEQMAGWATTKGLQTSKAYEYFRLKLPRQPWKAYIWKAFIPPKYSFIMWLGLLNRLATRDRLEFLHEEDLCSLCINTKESAKHLFFECPFSNYIWSHIRKEKIGSSVHNKARHLALSCMVYSLWRHRNEFIFEGASPNPEGLIISVKITVYRLL